MKRSIQRLKKIGTELIKLRQLKCVLIVFFLFFSARATSPDTKVVCIPASEPVDSYARLIKAIVQVESRGDTLAYNPKEKAIGAFQIRPIRLRDYNRRTGKDYNHQDCFNYKISREIFLYYAKKIGYPDYESIARSWNGSGKSTLAYWEKVKTLL